MAKHYSLNKSRRILHASYKFLKKKYVQRCSEKADQLKSLLESLEKAIFAHATEEASNLAKKAVKEVNSFPIPPFCRFLETAQGILFAIIIAFLVRQFWFELYEVPTGSMRPTIREKDRMIVSKTTYGLHVPFINKPVGFNEKSLERGSMVIFTVSNMDVPDPDTKYFGIIPGKKRYVKRCIAKPGDTVYFHGGRVYIIDRDNKPTFSLSSESILSENNIESIYHVPFISFDGSTEISRQSFDKVAVTLKQVNRDFGKIVLSQNSFQGFFFDQEWKEDQPHLLKEKREFPVSYSDLIGIGNFGIVRILTPKQAAEAHPDRVDSINKQSALAYLEIYHTPSTSYPAPLIKTSSNNTLIPSIHPFSTLLPLRKEHLHLIRSNLTTSRFVIKSGIASRYSPYPEVGPNPYAVSFPELPDGCYEYEKGQAYKIFIGGFRKKLPSSHPLMNLSYSAIIRMFNVGIGFSSIYSPENNQFAHLPHRYTFFNEGSLYLMDAPVFHPKDPSLVKFIEEEKELEKASTNERPYIAFIDRGSPIQNFSNQSGDLNQKDFAQFISRFGLKVPEGYILVLGDNYPMSADSREFGFVPIQNLLGSPVWKFWPLGEGFGKLPQVDAPKSLSFYIVNSIVLASLVLWFVSSRIKRHRRLFK